MLKMQNMFLYSVQWILHAVHDHFFCSTVSTGSDRCPGRVGKVNAGDKKKKNLSCSNIVCLAKGFVYEVKEGGLLRLVSGGRECCSAGFFFSLYVKVLRKKVLVS